MSRILSFGRHGWVLLLLLALAFPAVTQAIEKGRTAPQDIRVIIQLSDPPLAQYRDTLPGLKGVVAARTQSGHLDVKAPASAAYVNYLKQKQDAFIPQLLSAAPGAKVQWRYQISVNGLAARIQRSQMKAIRQLPGVLYVSETYKMTPELDESHILVNLDALQAEYTDPSMAGAGRRVAQIDSGCNAQHPFFNDTGFTAPAGYPKSYRWDSGVATPMDLATYTSNKVIVANVYVWPGDTSAEYGFPFGTGSDHATHVAGIMAGRQGTYDYDIGGQTFSLDFGGMAPGAYIMSYRVTGDVAEWIAATEDIIADQADALNISQGHSRWLTTDSQHDPFKDAVDSCADAGVVVAASAGNAGANGDSTITGSWKSSEKILTVAASTHAREFSNPVSVVAGPPNLTNQVGVPGQGYTPTATVTADFAIAPGGVAGNAGDACAALPAGSMTGMIAVVTRGTCSFAIKKTNVYNAGAIGLIVHQNSSAAPIIMGGITGTFIPCVMVTRQVGQDLVAYDAGDPTAQVTIDTITRLETGWPDLIASFSSIGPSSIMTIKPDIAAPGNNILSSIVDNPTGEVNPGYLFEQFGGTSMATPHVTGIAALVKGLHPTWTPAQIKSALMNTSNPNMFLDAGNTVYARAKHRGAGRIDAGYMIGAQATFAPQSLSFGLMHPGDSKAISVTVTDMRDASDPTPITYFPVLEEWWAGPTVSLPTSEFTLYAGQSATFSVYLSADAALAAGDYEGFIWVNDGGSMWYNLPYWVRVKDPAAMKDVLLVDWDRSPTYLDYVSTYTSALDSLGLTYDVFDAGTLTTASGNPGVSFSTLQDYRTVVLFMGDNYYPYADTHLGGSFPIQDYLNNGGRVLIIAQDYNSGVAYNQNQGSDFNLSSMAGWIQTDPDFYPISTGNEVLVTQFNLFGHSVDISYNNGGDGANNQIWPDAGRTVIAADREDPNIVLYNAPNIAPHARVLGNYTTTTIDGTPITPSSTAVSTGVAPDLTLEHPEATVNWYAAILHVGAEGVNSNLGADLTSVDVLNYLLSFLHDDVSLTVSKSGTGGGRTFTANPTSAVGATFTSYRWDFGDGTAIQTTTDPTVQHIFTNGGSFTVRVQATDELTRSSVASTSVVVYCPAITLSPTTLPDATHGGAYSQNLSAAGGTSPYTFAVTEGTLPGGLTLDPAGNLSGTATQGGRFDFTVTAYDAFGCTGTQDYSIQVPNNAPNAVDDETSVVVDSTDNVIDVLANDSDADGDTLAIEAVGTPANGTATIVGTTITYTPNTGFTGDDTFNYTINDGYGATDTANVTVHVGPACLYCDDFEDGVLPAWTYNKGTWNEAGGVLTGSYSRKATALTNTGVFAGCADCTVETTMQTGGDLYSKVSLYGWYNSKTQYVELMMKDGRWVLKERVGGVIIHKAKYVSPTDPNTPYTVSVSFDGSNFHVFVDGVDAITMPAGATGSGQFGYAVKGTTGTFGYITIN